MTERLDIHPRIEYKSEHSGHASIKLIVLDAGPSGDDQRFLEVRGRAVHQLDPPLGSLDSVANGDEVQDGHRDLLAEQTDLERPVQVPAVVVVLDEELQCHLRRDGLVDHLGLPQQRVLRRPRHHYHHRERHQPETCHADATLRRRKEKVRAQRANLLPRDSIPARSQSEGSRLFAPSTLLFTPPPAILFSLHRLSPIVGGRGQHGQSNDRAKAEHREGLSPLTGRSWGETVGGGSEGKRCSARRPKMTEKGCGDIDDEKLVMWQNADVESLLVADLSPSAWLVRTFHPTCRRVAVFRSKLIFDARIRGGHTDWVFDMEWIDDEFLVTGSRDSLLALWRVDNVDDSRTSRMTCLYVPEYAIKKPIFTKPCEKALKVRALTINHRRSEMAVLSLNAYFHLWDIETFHPLWINRLRCARENVCITVSEERNLYAVGSHSCFTLVDSRKKTEHQIPAKHRERGLFQGIRSLSFQKDIITIGTGVGLVMFYDIRAGKYLENPCGHPCQLLVGNGWLKHDESYQDIFLDNIYPNAIYTHAYDETEYDSSQQVDLCLLSCGVTMRHSGHSCRLSHQANKKN
ncbi:hypothetical protein C0Q70_20471 [Pomacea canaliculata]|uniref:DDB1- and CUL4-associated factor 12 beta-propeller domain-containing protein n=1 Tax=Pomacea canaliculata TaxID=400727 RepID=A0A2T7NFL5_POMCA|nr:hypothetical protein C0Q70_20471 [Pomacea canaliculata]